MKAIVWTKYGSPEVLKYSEVKKPLPKSDEVLIKIHATTVTAGDCEIRALRFPLPYQVIFRLLFGLFKPRNIVLGQELAGEIESIGEDVTLFKKGDQVFATTGIRFGSYAEYKCISENSKDVVMAIKPKNMSYYEAAAVPVGGLEALHFLRKANIRSGQKVLINGAGGSIGTIGIQLAKYFGAEVTAVDHGDKLDMLRSIGSDHVIDYTKNDFTKNDVKYDVVFDVVGKASFSNCIESIKENGYYLISNPKISHKIRGRWVSMTSNKKVAFDAVEYKIDNLIYLKQLIEAGNLKTVIDKCFPLEQTEEAHRYVDQGLKKGNVIITNIIN